MNNLGLLCNGVSHADYKFIERTLIGYKDVQKDAPVKPALALLEKEKLKFQKQAKKYRHWLGEIGIRAGCMIKVGKEKFNCAKFTIDRYVKDGEIGQVATKDELSKHSIWATDLFTFDEMHAIAKDMDCGELTTTAFAVRNALKSKEQALEDKIKTITIILNRYKGGEE